MNLMLNLISPIWSYISPFIILKYTVCSRKACCLFMRSAIHYIRTQSFHVKAASEQTTIPRKRIATFIVNTLSKPWLSKTEVSQKRISHQIILICAPKWFIGQSCYLRSNPLKFVWYSVEFIRNNKVESITGITNFILALTKW